MATVPSAVDTCNGRRGEIVRPEAGVSETDELVVAQGHNQAGGLAEHAADEVPVKLVLCTEVEPRPSPSAARFQKRRQSGSVRVSVRAKVRHRSGRSLFGKGAGRTGAASCRLGSFGSRDVDKDVRSVELHGEHRLLDP